MQSGNNFFEIFSMYKKLSRILHSFVTMKTQNASIRAFSISCISFFLFYPIQGFAGDVFIINDDIIVFAGYSGSIHHDDMDKFKTTLDPYVKDERIIDVRLSSQGGDAIAAMEIGRYLRSIGAFTGVNRSDVCASACIFVLLGGVVRDVRDSNLGIHRPYFDHSYFSGLTHQESQLKYKEMLAGVEAYLSEMGTTQDLFDFMTSIPSDEVVWLNHTESVYFKLHGVDPAWQEWNLAKDIKKYGKNEVERQKRETQFLYECSQIQKRPNEECLNELQRFRKMND